jgi:hypothetical protein
MEIGEKESMTEEGRGRRKRRKRRRSYELVEEELKKRRGRF